MTDMTYFLFIGLSLAALAFGLFQGIRDLMGKDPIIRRSNDRCLNDPEYRAMWQKKDGLRQIISCALFALYVLFINERFSMVFLTIGLVVNILYAVAYESWEHSND